MSEQALAPCPFCGHTPIDWPDFLHPAGIGWRDDDGDRHYLMRDDPRVIHGEVWQLGCLEHEGGCGAEVHGDSREEAIAAWNRRADTLEVPEPYRLYTLQRLADDTWAARIGKPLMIDLRDGYGASPAEAVRDAVRGIG